MKSVSVIIVLCTLPAGLGVIIDRLMLNRHKGRLHDALLRYWNHLDELSLPNIWQVFADYTIKFFSLVFGKKIRSYRFIITLILVSFCLTMCALLLSAFLDEKVVLSDFLNTLRVLTICLFVNLVFDTATGLVTVKVLSIIQDSTPAKAIALIVIDIILAFLFAIACIFFFGAVVNMIVLKIPPEPMATLHILLSLITRQPSQYNPFGLLYAGTTFIPTLIYLSILATLIISKVILGIVIRVTMYFLERATEVEKDKDLAVFTLTGSLFSVIVLLLTTFTMLCQALQ